MNDESMVAQGTVSNQPIVTNTPSNPATDHPTVEQLGDEENLSLLNDVPSAE
jgi:hypothetical protein